MSPRTLPIRPRALRLRLACAFLGGLLALAVGVVVGAPAKADPAGDYVARHAATVCGAITGRPTDAGIDDLLQRIVADGLSLQAAAVVVVDSVYTWCPQHLGVVEHYAGVNKRVIA